MTVRTDSFVSRQEIQFETVKKHNSDKLVFLATLRAKAEPLKEVLKQPDIDVNENAINGSFPLFNAAMIGYTDIVNILIKSFENTVHLRNLNNILNA